MMNFFFGFVFCQKTRFFAFDFSQKQPKFGFEK